MLICGGECAQVPMSSGAVCAMSVVWNQDTGRHAREPLSQEVPSEPRRPGSGALSTRGQCRGQRDVDSVAPGWGRVQILPPKSGVRDCEHGGAETRPGHTEWALGKLRVPRALHPPVPGRLGFHLGCGSPLPPQPGFHPQGPPAHFSLLARRRYSPTVMAFFWMLYCVKRPDWPVTTCWMGAGMTTSSMSSYVCRGFHSFGGMICRTEKGISGTFRRCSRSGPGARWGAGGGGTGAPASRLKTTKQGAGMGWGPHSAQNTLALSQGSAPSPSGCHVTGSGHPPEQRHKYCSTHSFREHCSVPPTGAIPALGAGETLGNRPTRAQALTGTSI